MFKIGMTSGVFPKCSCEGKSPVEHIEHYINKLTKTVKDVPCKCVAKTKIIQVTNGCFSCCEASKSCLPDSKSTMSNKEAKSCCCSGKISQSQCSGCCSSNACSQAAKDQCSGSCTNTNPPDTTNLCQGDFHWDYTSPLAVAADPKTARQLSRIVVPSTIADLQQSTDLQELIDSRCQQATDFQRTYCEQRPYPECEMCQFASQIGEVSAKQVLNLFDELGTCIDALTKGSVDLANKMLKCPGQLNMLLQEELGPLGKIVGPVAAGTVIGLTAMRGALEAFDGCVKTFAHTDLRVELGRVLGRALRSGGCGGQYKELITDVLDTMGISASRLLRSYARSSCSTGSCRGSSRSPYRACSSKASTCAAKCSKATKNCQSTVGAVKDKINKDVVANKTGSNASGSSSGSTSGTGSSGSSVEQAKLTTKKETTDTRADPDKTYSVPDPNDKTQTMEIEVADNEDLSPYVATYGAVLEEVPSPIDETPNAEDDTIPDNNKPVEAVTYTAVPTGATIQDGITYVKLDPTLGPSDAPRYVSETTEVGQTIPTDHTVYIKTDEGECTPVFVSEVTVNTSSVSTTTIKTIIPEAMTKDQRIIDDIETPVYYDSSAYQELVETPSLVTDTGVLAATIADLPGIDMTLDEIKMAYVIDAAVNGTEPPADVNYEPIKTILDNYNDDDVY